MKIDYFFMKCKQKLIRKLYGGDENIISKKFFEKNGITIGDNCCIYSDIRSSESFLISIGNNVTISGDVIFLTHDNSIDRISKDKCDVFGEINIGDNCFIGMRTTILPGVSLGNNVIVGSGSVVTKSFLQSGVIIGGNPAKVIGNVEQFLSKYNNIAFGAEDYKDGIYNAIKYNPHKIIRERK